MPYSLCKLLFRRGIHCHPGWGSGSAVKWSHRHPIPKKHMVVCRFCTTFMSACTGDYTSHFFCPYFYPVPNTMRSGVIHSTIPEQSMLRIKPRLFGANRPLTPRIPSSPRFGKALMLITLNYPPHRNYFILTEKPFGSEQLIAKATISVFLNRMRTLCSRIFL